MLKCVINVGHKPDSPGASNAASALSEFAFNDDLARDIRDAADGVEIILVYQEGQYRELPDQINKLKPDFVISLHCNAYDKMSSGTEVLYYYNSARSKRIASIMQNRLVSALQLDDRGIRPKKVEDRGGYLLCYTRAPCIICEPFFIDNDKDLERAMRGRDALVAAYVDAIVDIGEGLQEN